MSALSYFQDLYWREPLWLILSIQPLIIILLKKLIQKNNTSLYAEKKLQSWVVFPNKNTLTRKIMSKNTAYLLAWLLFSIALAGPRTPLTQVDKEQFYGANIMLVVDASRSMKAMDIKPNRLDRAITEIYEFLELAKEHRVGITVFSARPHLMIPLTVDHSILQDYIKVIDKLKFPTLGSDVVAAILFAQRELKNIKGNSAVVLITDGDYDNVTEIQLSKLKKHNIPLYILGVGTSEGEAIPLEDGSWLKNEQQYVVSRMNVETLDNLSKNLNGLYSSVYDDASDWEYLYNNGIARLNKAVNTEGKNKILWDEKFSGFLISSIFFFFISLNNYRFTKSKNMIAVPLFCLFLTSIPDNQANAIEFAQSNEQAAYRAYTNKEYLKADQYYENIEIKLIFRRYFGQGSSLYKLGHYKKAIQQFTFAFLNAKDDRQRAKSLYNLANSYFRTGNFLSAINTYKDVLHYQPNNKASLYNINISQILKNNLEQRLKEEQRIIALSRQSNGPRSTAVNDNVELNENTSVSIGESNMGLNKDIPLPELPNINEDTIKKLLISGLKNIKLANNNNEKKSILEKKSEIKVVRTQQKLNNITDTQYILWKRLFEIEEGFPAPVEEPRVVPGLKPW